VSESRPAPAGREAAGREAGRPGEIPARGWLAEEETRGFLKLRGLALLLTVGAIIVTVVALALVAVFPAVVNRLDLGRAGELAASAARWVVLAVLILIALAVV
jgi:uncharacterized BrkB/YihY/UPF0761 family membrane protein